MIGIIVDKLFKIFEYGFFKEIIEEFEKKIGRKVVGNKLVLGIVIIDEYGEY